jgi:hypothetical protein
MQWLNGKVRELNSSSLNVTRAQERVDKAKELLDDILNEFGDKAEIQLQTERIREIRGLLEAPKPIKHRLLHKWE